MADPNTDPPNDPPVDPPKDPPSNPQSNPQPNPQGNDEAVKQSIDGLNTTVKSLGDMVAKLPETLGNIIKVDDKGTPPVDPGTPGGDPPKPAEPKPKEPAAPKGRSGFKKFWYGE